MAETRYIVDRFHKQLYPLIQNDIQHLVNQLVSGSAANYVEYREQVKYIQALNDVIDRCAEIERNIYGEQRASTQAEE